MQDLSKYLNENLMNGNDADMDGIEDVDYNMMKEAMYEGMCEGMKKVNSAYKKSDMMDRKMMEAGMARMVKEAMDDQYGTSDNDLTVPDGGLTEPNNNGVHK